MSESPQSRPERDPATQMDADLERELEQALEGQSVEELMEASASGDDPSQQRTPAAGEQSAAESPADPAHQPETEAGQAQGQPQEQEAAAADSPKVQHDMRRGRIAAIRGDEVFVELTGAEARNQGIVPLSQFDRPPRIGSIMDFVVDRVDESQGLVFLSREGAVSRATWEQLQRGAAVAARVIGHNKGGLELEMVGGIRAFMPASQLDMHHVEDIASWVGQKLEAIVQEIDRRSKKVVLSRRQLLQQRKEEAKRRLYASLEPGQIIDGKVSSVREFGAFVDIGGIDGLVHVSDMSYTHVTKPSEVVQAGQDVRVKVLKVDPESERISLGLKQVEPDPWEGIEGRFQPHDQVEGKIVRTTSFGAFVELQPGVEGLLPISEMSWRRIGKAEEVVKAGDHVRLAVLSVDAGNRRISLSLRQAQGDPWVGAEHKFPAQSLVDGKVIGTTDFGAFVELEPGIEGLVHISELSPRRVNAVGDVLNVGDEKQFRVLEIDEENRKVRLSLKQVEAPHELTEQQAGQTQAKAGAASKPARKKSRKGLKGGMESGGAMGQGLGDLKL